MDDKTPFYRQLMDLAGKAGRGVKDFFVDGPAQREEQMLNAERARNEEMMRGNGMMQGGEVMPPMNPDLYGSIVPKAIAQPATSFMERLMQARAQSQPPVDDYESRTFRNY